MMENAKGTVRDNQRRKGEREKEGGGGGGGETSLRQNFNS